MRNPVAALVKRLLCRNFGLRFLKAKIPVHHARQINRQRLQRADPLSAHVRQIQRSKLYFGYDGPFNVLSEAPG